MPGGECVAGERKLQRGTEGSPFDRRGGRWFASEWLLEPGVASVARGPSTCSAAPHTLRMTGLSEGVTVRRRE
jgi:hypothetical protein